MYLTEEQLQKYACKLERKFIAAFMEEYKDNWYNHFNTQGLYDSNDMLKFLLDYSEVNDKSKEYYYFMCMKTFNDVPSTLSKKYKIKFGLVNCGNEIYNSYGCAHSNLLINCNGIKQSFGCDKCKFSDHLIFCTEQRHKSYMAFNKPITKQRYHEIIAMSPEQLATIPEFNAEIYAQLTTRIEYIYRLKDNA